MRSFRALAVLAALVFVLAATPVALAEDRDPPAPPKKEEGPEVTMAKQMVGLLRHELDLSEEQVERVTRILQDGIKSAMKKMFERMGDDNPPTPEQRKKDETDIREGILGKIREVLDAGQKREFEALVKEFDQRLGRFERQQNAPGGPAAQWFEGELPTKERLLVKTENVLLLNEEEKAVVLPRVDAVVTARAALREARLERRRDLSRAVHGGAKEDEMKERLHALRAKEDQLKERLEKAEADLRELLSIDQEARLVAIGVLD